MEKMDARKRYTQMVLKQSFLKLLKEKPVNKITVKEVCALAQLNRAGKGDPDMTSLRESGQIEQDADAILLIHWPDQEDSTRELIIAKNKEGETGKNFLRFDGKHQTFSEFNLRQPEF